MGVASASCCVLDASGDNCWHCYRLPYPQRPAQYIISIKLSWSEVTWLLVYVVNFSGQDGAGHLFISFASSVRWCSSFCHSWKEMKCTVAGRRSERPLAKMASRRNCPGKAKTAPSPFISCTSFWIIACIVCMHIIPVSVYVMFWYTVQCVGSWKDNWNLQCTDDVLTCNSWGHCGRGPFWLDIMFLAGGSYLLSPFFVFFIC